MSLKEQITKTDYMDALRSKNDAKKKVLAEIKGAIKNKEISTQKDVSDADIVNIIKKCVKELHESIDGYTKSGNMEMVTELTAREPYFDVYLPDELSESDLNNIVSKIVSDIPNDQRSMKNMGNIMNQAKDVINLTGKGFDGKKLSIIVRFHLA